MPSTVVFDLGGVLIDWDPRHLYRRLFDDEATMEDFLANVCTPDWNEQQDAGRPIAEATAEAIGRHPGHKAMIEAYYQRFDEMWAGAISDTVAVLDDLHARTTPLYALTNWSAETFPIARRHFDFLGLFRGILVSGEEQMKKPDPRIFQLLGERYQILLDDSVFIDDNEQNIEAARDAGMRALHFTNDGSLRGQLEKLGLL